MRKQLTQDTFPVSMEGCVLYLPLHKPDGAMTGTTIRSYDNVHTSCTVTGATWGNQGITFNGGDYITFGTLAGLASVPAISVEFWFKFAAGGAATQYVIDGWGDTFLIRIATNVFDWRVNGGGTSSGVQTATTLLTDYIFHHCLFTYDGANLHTFIDDVEQGNAVAETGALTGAADYSIGEDRGISGTVDLVGTMGEARIYNRALSAGEGRYNRQATRWRYVS